MVPPELANVQLGMVNTYTFPVSKANLPVFPVSEEGMRLWETYFAPHMGRSGGSTCCIPVSWFNFIILMLLTPEKFEWTKSFLKSSLWDIVKEADEGYQSFKFVIPDSCVFTQAPMCQIQGDKENSAMQADDVVLGSSTSLESATPRKRRGKGPLVEDEVRRSPRIQAINKGFRSSPCQNNACFPYTAIPPKLSNKIVRNLASSFCKVAEQELDAKLNKRAKKNDDGKEAREGKGKDHRKKETDNADKEKDVAKGKKTLAKKK